MGKARKVYCVRKSLDLGFIYILEHIRRKISAGASSVSDLKGGRFEELSQWSK